jgi:uncharacterized protein (DUF433 family)
LSWCSAGDRAKDAELLVLRHENAVLRRHVGRVRYEPVDRMWFAALARLIPRTRWSEVFPVTPATLLAWHRKLAAKKYDTSRQRAPAVRSIAGSGRRLLIDLQDRSHLDPEFCLVAITNGQTVLTAPGEEFFERVDWSGDQLAGWRPHEDPASPIRLNPLVRFGMPAIGGISTEAIAGELDGGASLEEVAEDFGLDLDAVRWAQSYELSQHAAA